MLSWLFAAALAWSAPEAPADDPIAPLLAMPPALRDAFAERVLADTPSRQARLERLVDFVFDADGMGMRYDDAATHTVAEAYAARRANCLGFTLVFLALAREAGLDARPQVVAQALAWQEAQGVFYRSGHVNVEIRFGARAVTLDVLRDSVITRGRPVTLTPTQLRAHYHNNLAMAAVASGDFATARRHMAEALARDPGHAGHWSNAGVLYLRDGDAAAARAANAEALRLAPDHANALFNAVGLARRNGDTARVRELRARLERMQRRDPFHHFLQAHDHDRAGDLARAIEHYRRAIALHGRDHRFHAALADALERSGDSARARTALQRAAALSDGAARSAYEARLRAWRSEAEQER